MASLRPERNLTAGKLVENVRTSVWEAPTDPLPWKVGLSGIGRLGLSREEAYALRAQLPVPPAPRPEPEPEPRAEPRPAGLLWAADASRPFADEWAAGNAFDVRGGEGTHGSDPGWRTTSRIVAVEHAGRRAWRATIVDGDRDKYTSGAQRTEMGQGSPSRAMPDGVERRMVEGREYWLAWNLLIPSSYPDVSAWCALTQIKGANNSGNGPFGFALWNGRLLFDKSLSQVQTSTNTGNLWQSPSKLTRDRWIRVLLNVRWSLGADGHYAMWLDLADGRGMVERVPRRTGWTLKNNSEPKNPIGLRLGIYRQQIAGTHSVFFSGVCCGETREAVTRHAFGASL